MDYILNKCIAWKASKGGVISGPYYPPVFSPITGKYGPEITPYFWTLFPQWYF